MPLKNLLALAVNVFGEECVGTAAYDQDLWSHMQHRMCSYTVATTEWIQKNLRRRAQGVAASDAEQLQTVIAD